MTTYFISRHGGAVEWAKNKGITADVLIEHTKPEFFDQLKVGDAVIGILPVSLAAKVCAAGAYYYDLSLPNLPLEWRGKELTAAQMDECGAELKLYDIRICPF